MRMASGPDFGLCAHVVLRGGLNLPTLGFGTFRLRGELCVRSVEHAIAVGYRRASLCCVSALH